MSCPNAVPRGHVLWPLKARQIAAHVKSIHFEYISSSESTSSESELDSQKCLVKSEPLLIDQLLASSSNSVDRLSIESPEEEEEDEVEEEEDDEPILDGSVPLTPQRMLACDEHHYSPLWLKTTGESVYRFDRICNSQRDDNEPIYETLYPLTCCRISGEDPPPLPPRNNTATTQSVNAHKPLTRTNALMNYSNWSRPDQTSQPDLGSGSATPEPQEPSSQVSEDEVEPEAANPPPPPPPRPRIPAINETNAEESEPIASAAADDVSQVPPELPVRTHLPPPALPKRMETSASPELPPRSNCAKNKAHSNKQRNGSVSPAPSSSSSSSSSSSGGESGARSRTPTNAPSPAPAARLPSISTLPLRTARFQRIELPGQEESPLPDGWEARMDSHGRVFYIDHKTRSTSWERPKVTVVPPTDGSKAPENPEGTYVTVQSISNDAISRQQLDRRYQSIRRTINRRDRRDRRREEIESSESDLSTLTSDSPPPIAPRPQTPPTNADTLSSGSSAHPGDFLSSPALQFVTRPDFYALLHAKEAALQLYNRSSAVRQLLTKLWRNPTTFQRYQHNRDFVTLVNLFADESRPLPSEWECRHDKHGRPFFIDHRNKSTSYIDPRLPKLGESFTSSAAGSDDQSDSGRPLPPPPTAAAPVAAVPSEPYLPPVSRAPTLPPRPPFLSAGRNSPVPSTSGAGAVGTSASAVPTAYNEKVVAFLRQPNIVDILKERHPEFSRNGKLRDKVNTVRAEGTSALDRLSDDLDLTILLSLFEEEIMSYVPPSVSSSGMSALHTAIEIANGNCGNRASPRDSPHSSPAPGRGSIACQVC